MNELIRLLGSYVAFWEMENCYATLPRDLEIDIDRQFGWKIMGKHEIQIISKQFGFIKRLIENDKIDLNRIPQKFEGYYDDKREYIYDEESILIMELAIQDNPIEFLIDILKQDD